MADAGPADGVEHSGISYTANGAAHVVLSGEVAVQEDLSEKAVTLCGANVPKKTLELNGMRLTDEHRKGKMCETCLETLKRREVTIPGFLVDGEVVDRGV